MISPLGSLLLEQHARLPRLGLKLSLLGLSLGTEAAHLRLRRVERRVRPRRRIRHSSHLCPLMRHFPLQPPLHGKGGGPLPALTVDALAQVAIVREGGVAPLMRELQFALEQLEPPRSGDVPRPVAW